MKLCIPHIAFVALTQCVTQDVVLLQTLCRPSAQSNASVNVAETVQHFITAMDSLKLNMAAVDQVQMHVTLFGVNMWKL